MDFFDAIVRRRSIRRFTDEAVPDSVVDKALDAAVWAPNSSNVQTWNFYWVKDPEKKADLVTACLGQSAARTARHLVVITADSDLWRRSLPHLQRWTEEAKAPRPVRVYYEKLIPVTYRSGWFNVIGLFKWIGFNVTGLFRPSPRGPNFRRDLDEVAIKSAALAAENFVLAIAAQDFDSCMMEGFDAVRVRKSSGLPAANASSWSLPLARPRRRGPGSAFPDSARLGCACEVTRRAQVVILRCARHPAPPRHPERSEGSFLQEGFFGLRPQNDGARLRMTGKRDLRATPSE
jgi:nitroreductase